LVTDVQMPGTRDGLALARIVRERWPDAGIVVVSADRHDWEDGLVDASFIKPYPMPAVVAALAALLASEKRRT
jgi:DNA-binding NarL/FixJ family response regulator